jgi:hypothetical protein
MLTRLDDLANEMLATTKAHLRTHQVPALSELVLGLDEIQQLAFDAGYRRALQDGPLREDMGR